MTASVEERCRGLAARLAGMGVLGDPGWRVAFEEVPRHVFVPRFYAEQDGRVRVVDGADPAQREHWLEAVYSDDLLVVQRLPADGLTDPDGEPATLPSSSSSMPSLMAFMLDTLDAADGMSVLEIGTGTGYTAGLLSHRLGDRQVASIDIHPDLITTARERLAGLGYHPRLAAGDGTGGMPSAAPFDRILSTAATPTIPAAWIDQLHPGGKILTDTRADRAGGLVLLTKTDPDTVTGRFVPSRAHFMWLRPDTDNPIRPGEPFLTGLDLRTTGHTTTTLNPAVLTTTLDFWFFTQLVLPGAALLPELSLPTGPVTYLSAPGSFAMINPTPQPDGTHTVDHGGTDNPWRHVETAWYHWHNLGTPTPDRFGLTATHQQQWTWLDEPERRIP